MKGNFLVVVVVVACIKFGGPFSILVAGRERVGVLWCFGCFGCFFLVFGLDVSRSDWSKGDIENNRNALLVAPRPFFRWFVELLTESFKSMAGSIAFFPFFDFLLTINH